MRAGLSTIQQTLTPEAAAVLGQSMSEASRRNHGHTTPLHVGAALLASPSGYLRQACIRSHPDSSHPLQCRALELCFSVALERLPSAAQPAAAEPPVSNALMAALKRAQAHQRRGSPEQQQQPLLAVKVELEQLIISILDDPSVSRVMKEVGFSSPTVKATIEQSLTSSSSTGHRHHHHVVNKNTNFVGISQRMLSKTAPLNPRLQPGGNVNTKNNRGDEVNKLLDIMMRTKRRNPILVGDSGPEDVVKEFLKKIENKEVLQNTRIISIEKENCVFPSMIGESVIIDLGDLRWLVNPRQLQQGRAVVVEMAHLLDRFNRERHKVWLIGTANCETYLRCQVYFSSMENEWDLQAVPLASHLPSPRMFGRFETQNGWNVPVQPLKPLVAFNQTQLPAITWHTFEKLDPFQRTLCPQCLGNYEKELAKIEANDKSYSEAARPALPQWLQKANLDNLQEMDHHGLILDRKIQELHRKWRDTCLHLHPNSHQKSSPDRPSPPTLLSMTSLHSLNPPASPILKPLKEPLHLNTNKVNFQQENSSPPSPILTDLVLGRNGPNEKLTDHKSGNDTFDMHMYKRLLKRLMEHAWWQPEAASKVASVVMRRRMGRGDTWLLFAGPDSAAKKKMSSVLAKDGGGNLVTIRQDEGLDAESRGKTAVDRMAEAVRRNPFDSVIVVEGAERWGPLARGSIRRAAELGRIADSHGREVGLGNTIFILSGDWWLTDNNLDEHGIPSVSSWRLGLRVRESISKRPRREAGPALSLDLNLALPEDEREKADGSPASSDVTVDHEEELLNWGGLRFAMTVPRELVGCVDGSVVFKPLSSGFIMREIRRKISVRFLEIVGRHLSVEVEDEVLERILGGLLCGRTSLEEWVGKVLEPEFERLGQQLASDERSGSVVHLVVESDDGQSPGEGGEHWLPSTVLVCD